MATYFVSNAGSNTSPYDTEAKAATSLATVAALWTATDVVRVSSTHTETASAAISYTFPTTPGLQILSVTFNGSGTGALAAGGTINVGASSNSFTFGASGFAYAYGLTLVGGTNNNTACDLFIGGTGALSTGIVMESCTLSVPSASTGAQISIGPEVSAANDDMITRLINCTFSNGAAKSMILRCGNIFIDNMTLAGTAPTTLFSQLNARQHNTIITASDLSNLAWTNVIDVSVATNSSLTLKQCKLRASFSATTGSFAGPGGTVVTLIDCNSGDVNYYFAKHSWEGSVIASNSVYYDATEGSNSISWQMTSSANASFVYPLETPEIHFFNDTLSAMTTTVEVVNDGTTFKDNELWQETLAKVTSGSPVGTWNRGDRAADILATGANQTTSTVTWTGTGGFSSPVKQKLVSTSFTPAEVGVIATVVKLAKASSTVYVSPKVFAGSRQWQSNSGNYINERPFPYGGNATFS